MMNKFFPLLMLLIIAGCTNKNPEATNEDISKALELVWADEFDYEGTPDPEKWGYREGGDGWGNNEAQNYTKRPENVIVENGHLKITARKENYEGSSYTSAAVITYGKQDFLYGRVEVRAKLPAGLGTWPAIWMLGNSIREGKGWPACGEIDIMEHVGFDSNTVHGNIHTKAHNFMNGLNKGDKIFIEGATEDFHVYAIEWHKDKIDFFVDDEKYFTYTKESDDADVWPFDEPQYLLINLTIGGSWGGSKGIDDAIFPVEYLVDYVRYYGYK